MTSRAANLNENAEMASAERAGVEPDASVVRKFEAPYHVQRHPGATPDHQALRHIVSGPLSLTEIHVGEMEAINRPVHGSKVHARVDFKFVRQGELRVFVSDRAVRIGPGEMMLVDHEERYSFITGQGTDCICVAIPRHLLTRQNPRWESAAFHKLPSDAPFVPAMAAFLTDWAGVRDDDHTIIGAQFSGLLALVLRGQNDGSGSNRSDLAGRIIGAIREQCANSDLCAESLAASIGISRRHLYTVLASADTSFGREVMNARLETSRTILTNPVFDNLRIGEVAYLTGFQDQAHFSRRFRTRFGQSPRDFRRATR